MTEQEDALRRRVKGEGHLTMEHLQEHERKLRDHIAELHAGDKTEREELKSQLAEIQEHIKAQKKTQEAEDEVKNSTTTLVVPPNDIPPQQANATAESEQPTEKRSKWKQGWHSYLEAY